MPIIRTPEKRFKNLPEYPFEPKYVEINGLRVHYVDEGTGNPVLCLHGEPSWSFLYRKMIHVLKEKHRAIAPDLIGFGKSDKFTEIEKYTYEMHRDTIKGFIEKLDLKNITLVCQDWGGLIGLRVVSMIPDRFARLVIMNTGLPDGNDTLQAGFMTWRKFAERVPILPIGIIMKFGTMPIKKGQKPTRKMRRQHFKSIPKGVIKAYQAPFPSSKYKAGARKFPLMVPIAPTDPVASEMVKAREVLAEWDKPVQVMFSDGDAITRGGDVFFRELIPTAKDQPEITIKDAGHFLQENKGEEIARHILEFIERTRT